MMGKHSKSKSVAEWLGLESQRNLLAIKWLGPIISVIVGLAALVLCFLILILFVDLFRAIFRVDAYANDTNGAGIRNIGLVLIALFGAPFLVWRSVVAARLAKTSDDRLFNEKITAFANQLAARRQVTRTITENGTEFVLTEWEDDLVARAAAIDGFEGLASERPSMVPRVVRLIANYVKGTFPCQSLEPSEDLTIRVAPRMDLQKSIDLIGRLLEPATTMDNSNWRLDLTSCNLDGVNFGRRYFRAANFSGSRLEAAVLDFANFEGCLFHSCLLNHGSFFGTNLIGACFDYVTLNRPTPVPNGFNRSLNMGKLKGATFISANITALDYLGTPAEVSETFGTQDTVTSTRLRPSRPENESHQNAFYFRMVEDRSTLNDEQANEVLRLEETGFQNWSPFTTNDGATGHILTEFRKQLKMNVWPFTNS